VKLYVLLMRSLYSYSISSTQHDVSGPV